MNKNDMAQKVHDAVYGIRPRTFNPELRLSEFHTGTPLFKSPEELRGRIEAYLKEAMETEQPLTLTGLARSIGVTRKKLMEYQEWYKDAQNDDERSEWLQVNRIITAAIAICEQYWEESLLQGGAKPQGVIFGMVNNFGWRNKLDVEGSTNSEELAEIRQAYQALLKKDVKEQPKPENDTGLNPTEQPTQ